MKADTFAKLLVLQSVVDAEVGWYLEHRPESADGFREGLISRVSDLLDQIDALDAVAAARAVDYVGAGTVEFLYQNGEFFFLEMNTRIQVEHPVTELVTRIDLVQWQIRIAAGEPLTFSQEELRWTGHAIECRITSEDPTQGFMPSTGTIEALQVPAGPGVRWDGGIDVGYEVGLHYDPMLAKLIVHAPDRPAAIERMKRALAETRIVGVHSSIPFHLSVMDEPDFRAGEIDIRYLERHEELLGDQPSDEDLRDAALAVALLEQAARARPAASRAAAAGSSAASAWKRPFSWRGR